MNASIVCHLRQDARRTLEGISARLDVGGSDARYL
jgi:hypothetical protein